MLESLWIHDPTILFSSSTWFKFVPLSYMDVPTAMNSIVRFTVYFSLIMALCKDTMYLTAIPLVLILTVVVSTIFPNVRSLESFASGITQSVRKYTYPTADNPFMNPLLTEIHDNPNRPDAAPITSFKVKKQIEKAFQQTTDIYMDTTDRFDLANSMRSFHTLQSAKIPNDQEGFLKFLEKGNDLVDTSSAFPSRNAKIFSEGYTPHLGTSGSLPNSTDKPTGTAPTGPTK